MHWCLRRSYMRILPSAQPASKRWPLWLKVQQLTTTDSGSTANSFCDGRKKERRNPILVTMNDRRGWTGMEGETVQTWISIVFRSHKSRDPPRDGDGAVGNGPTDTAAWTPFGLQASSTTLRQKITQSGSRFGLPIQIWVSYFCWPRKLKSERKTRVLDKWMKIFNNVDQWSAQHHQLLPTTCTIDFTNYFRLRTIQASNNFASHGNLAHFLARCVAPLGGFGTKNKKNQVRRFKLVFKVPFPVISSEKRSDGSKSFWKKRANFSPGAKWDARTVSIFSVTSRELTVCPGRRHRWSYRNCGSQKVSSCLLYQTSGQQTPSKTRQSTEGFLSSAPTRSPSQLLCLSTLHSSCYESNSKKVVSETPHADARNEWRNFFFILTTLEYTTKL